MAPCENEEKETLQNKLKHFFNLLIEVEFNRNYNYDLLHYFSVHNMYFILTDASPMGTSSSHVDSNQCNIKFENSSTQTSNDSKIFGI